MEGRYVLLRRGLKTRCADRGFTRASPYDQIVEAERDATGSVTLAKHP